VNAGLVTRPGLAQRDRAKVRLALTMEYQLAEVAADSGRPSCPWDAWWVCYRSGVPAAELGWATEPPLDECCCQRCRHDAWQLACRRPEHPDSLGPRSCDCLHEWAVRMRRPAPEPAWPALRTTLALIKPRADRDAVLTQLATRFVVIDCWDRQLTAGDVRRLYPDAYGADHVARLTDYLTSAPVHTLVLLAPVPGLVSAKRVKSGIRQRLGGADPLRNHLHLPDDPGEALCDLRHLVGHDLLLDLYRRYDRDGAGDRIARYRALLARG